MSYRILEFADSGQLSKERVDRGAGVIKGVKLLGTESRNPPPHNNSYPLAMRQQSARLFENSPVFMDHPPRSQGDGVRSVREKMGFVRQVRESGEGLVGDWCFPPSHSFAQDTFWMAENDPAGICFSINAEADKIRHEGGRKIIESLAKVHSIDLVTRGATTRSLFEGLHPMTTSIKQILEALILKHANAWNKDAKKILEDDYAPMMDNPVEGTEEMSTDDAGIEAMCTMLKAAAKEGNWDKVREIVKGFEKMLSEKEPKEKEGGESDEKEKTEESLKQHQDELKRVRESSELRIKARDMANDAGVSLTAGRRRVLDACTDEKQIKEALEDFKADAPKTGQKPKSSGPQTKKVQEGQSIPEDVLKDGKRLAEYMRS